MRTNNMMKAACLMLMASATTSAFAQKMNIEHKGDTTIIKVENPTKYLLLPIQEEKDEAQVLLDTGSKDDTWMDVRLAQNGSDYFVCHRHHPFSFCSMVFTSFSFPACSAGAMCGLAATLPPPRLA